MNFYNISWLAIFIAGGICLGLLALGDGGHLTLLTVNPLLLNRVLLGLEEKVAHNDYGSPRPALNPAKI
ncbi:MAG: hypothetical protein P8184_16605 [Calditrichia bacterium]